MDKFKTFVKKALAVALLFLCCLSFAPWAGVFRTIPFLFVGAIICAVMGVNKKMCLSFTFIMCLIFNLTSHMSVATALILAFVGCCFAFFGMAAFKCLVLSRRTKNNSVKTKCVVLCGVFVAACAFLSVLFCGNTFSYLGEDGQNTEYIKKSYGSNVSKQYTVYDAQNAEYRTYVTLKETDKVGKPLVYNDMYICQKDGKLYDLVRDYYEEEILEEASVYIGKAIMGEKDGFAIVKSDIDFPKGELVFSDGENEKYFSRVKYVALYDSVIKDGEKEQFEEKCEYAVSELVNVNMDFDKLFLCAGDGERIIYCAVVDANTRPEQVRGLVTAFDEQALSGFGASKDDILKYWQNN